MKEIRRKIDTKLMASILEAQQLQGAKQVTRRQMFDMMQPISPRTEVGAKKQKLGVDFSDMLQDAAAMVIGAKFAFDVLPSGKRSKVRVEF